MGIPGPSNPLPVITANSPQTAVDIYSDYSDSDNDRITINQSIELSFIDNNFGDFLSNLTNLPSEYEQILEDEVIQVEQYQENSEVEYNSESDQEPVHQLVPVQPVYQPVPVQQLPNMANNQQNQLDQVILGIGNLVNAMQQHQQAPQAARPREISLVKIEPFYGDDQDPIGWLEDFEKAAITNGYTEARKLAIVRAYLKGTAAAWLTQRMQDPATNPTT